jgi:uncharacterized protein YcbX
VTLAVSELWRYPVKSLLGERLTWTSVGPEGFLHDREYAVFDSETGLGLTARREPKLLFLSAESTDNGHGLLIRNEKGKRLVDDKALSKALGRSVELRQADFDGTRTYEVPLDVETEAPDSWVSWNGPRGAFHDSTRTRVSLVSRATTGDWDTRRFRSNVVLDGAGEDELVGKRIRIGDVVLDVTKQIDRCVMVTRPQGNGLDRNLDVLKTINHDRAGNLAIGALVIEPGVIKLGQPVEIVGD